MIIIVVNILFIKIEFVNMFKLFIKVIIIIRFYFYFQVGINNFVYLSDNVGSCVKGQNFSDKQVNGNEVLVIFINGMLFL